jgi:L-ascorbate metabolism protein UlaG (beta-lactamase superfamily)
MIHISRILLLSALCLSLNGIVLAQNPGNGKVTITHYGCADFVIDNGSEIIYIDPLSPNSRRFYTYSRAFRTDNNPIPDLVLSTHQDHDHCEPEAIKQLVDLNDNLIVVVPEDERDVLNGVIDPKHVRSPKPVQGQPETFIFGNTKVRIYQTMHGWHINDENPYTLSGRPHFSYLIETNGIRIYMPGDSDDFEEVARDVDNIDVALFHASNPTDVYALQQIQSRLSPRTIIPYHFYVPFGVQRESFAGLVDTYQFQNMNVRYLTKENRSLELSKDMPYFPPPEPGETGTLPNRGNRSALGSQSDAATVPVTIKVHKDMLYRGTPENNIFYAVAHVRNRELPEITGRVSLRVPEQWVAEPIDDERIDALSEGRDFICRYKIRVPDTAVFDGLTEYDITGTAEYTAVGRSTQISGNYQLGGGGLYQWKIIGPFPSIISDGGDAVYPPEAEIDFQKIYSGRDNARLRWQNYKSRDLLKGYVDFMAAFYELPEIMPRAERYYDQHVVGYAVSYIYSPDDRDVLFHVGAPYGLQLFVNNTCVFNMPGTSFDFSPEQFEIPVQLQAGRNTILVKIVKDPVLNNNVPNRILAEFFGFCARVTDQTNMPIWDLRFASE